MKSSYKFPIAAAAIFFCSFALFLLTLCQTAFPFGSADQVAVHLGLSPFAPSANPIWGFLLRLVAGLPGDPVLNIHRFSALLGALTLVVLFFVIVRFSHDRTREERSSSGDDSTARMISGLFGCTYLAVNIPFWLVSTRAFPISLGELIFLVCVLLGLSAFYTKRKWLIFPTCLLWGIGLAEFATFIVFSPVFLLFALGFAYVTRRKLSVELLFRMFACVLLGMLLYLVTAYFAWQHPSARWKSMPGYYDNLLHVLKMQKFMIIDVIPKQGWLLLALTSIMPLVVVLAPKTAEKHRGVWTSKLMHLVFFAVGVLMMLNTFISPWSMFKMAPLTVTPAVLCAIWMGYIAGYGYMIFRQGDVTQKPFTRLLLTTGRFLHIPVLLAVVAWAGWSNLRIVDGRHTGLVDEWASGVLDGLEEGDWLISSMGVENAIRLKAYVEGREIRIIDPAMSQRNAYRWYLASLFDDSRLKGLAHISLNALLTEWLSKDPAQMARVAVARTPDFWYAAEETPKPSEFVYRNGGAALSADDLTALVARHQARWATMDVGYMGFVRDSENPLAPMSELFLREHSKMANNIGVMCEKYQLTDLAIACYQQARIFDPDNPSALLNLYQLAEKGVVKEGAKITAAFNAFLSDQPSKLHYWALSRHYGYVYNATAYLDLGISWAVSGKPKLAIAEIKQAMEIAKDSDRMRHSLAAMYFSDMQLEESEKIYVDLLTKNEKDLNALVGLARIEMLRGEIEIARGYLDRVRAEAGDDNVAVLLEAFGIEYMAGNRDVARDLLERVLKKEPNSIKAWTGLAVMAAEEGDDTAFIEVSEKIRTSREINNGVRVMFAQLQSGRGNYTEARKLLVQVLAVEPNNIHALEQLLRIHVRQRDRAEADRRVKQLLDLDPGSAYGNQVLGSLQYLRRQMLLAEASYRASLRAERNPEVLNSLAYVLSAMNKNAEAYPLITESIELNPRNPAAWDTMAMVQLGLKKPELAHASILRALELSPGNKTFLMHHAMIFERRGDKDEALRIVRELTKDLDSFPSEYQGELLNLQARLRRK